MKRFLFSLLSLLLLTACTAVERLDPNDVLERAADASRTLQSAHYDTQVSLSVLSPDGRRMEGRLVVSGNAQIPESQSAFSIDIDGTVTEAGTEYSIQGLVDVILLGAEQFFLKIQSLAVDPSSGLLSEELLTILGNDWWLLPSDVEESSPESIAVSPDPKLLHLQSQVVSLKEDRGLEKLGERNVYVLDVELDEEKLLAFLSEVATSQGQTPPEDLGLEIRDTVGTLWIDAESFVLRKVEWTIGLLKAPDGTEIQGSFSATVSEYNNALPVSPPADYRNFSPEEFIAPPSLTPINLQQPRPVYDDDLVQYLLDNPPSSDF